jgi:molybdenum cofactor biosynthesis enzyme MoaA
MKSLGIMVGTGSCNANCRHCAGIPHRKDAPQKDGEVDETLVLKTLRQAHGEGAERLSLSGSGEPVLSPVSVTKVLEISYSLRKEGVKFDPISLYSNGIRIGEDPEFCSQYLPLWNALGLSWVYVTVHSVDPSRNAKGFGVSGYPSLKTILKRIKQSGMRMRANLVLSKEGVGTFAEFKEAVGVLVGLGVDSISAWPIRDKEDEVDRELAPSDCERDRMDNWAKWRMLPVKVLGGREAYKNGDKMTLFPNGTLSSNWCK